ncbi:MAG: hypothetical protein LBE89_01640 [Helicobacteraceae bacterium]|jgi:flagellar hook-associated protein 3 FlgL|nr:hypothetical protein [Helicobacteraceae bacterium]
MRVSTSAIYNSFIVNQQRALSDLLNVNDQMSSGLKIHYGYEESTIYQDALRLISERSELTQVSDNVQKAKTFSDNSDTALSSMIQTLETFKVKLVQAANDVHSTTSYAALASNLEALMFSIRDIANTSINGNFLFSGTDVKQKPFDENGNYYGNDQQIKAQAGDRVEIVYNIDGYTLAQGFDSDYGKRITTNMQLYNQTLLHHRTLSVDDPMGLDVETPITVGDTIRDLIGQPDNTKPTYFYIRGSRPDGESFKSRFELTNYATVQDLLDQIGREMGNTNVYQSVEVTLSELGHIEVKDVKSGQMLTDFHLFASDVETDDINTLGETENAHIFAFNKSGYSYVRTQDTIASAQDFYDQRSFVFETTLRRQDTEAKAEKSDTARSIMGESIDRVTFTINGVAHTFAVSATTTMGNLTDAIKSELESSLGGSFDVDLRDGRLAVFDNSASSPTADEFVPTLLSGITITAENSLGGKVLAFAPSDAVGYDRAYFEKEGAVFTSAVSQVTRSGGSYATAVTQLQETSGASNLDETRLHLEFIDVNGNRKLAEITLRDIPDENGRLSTFQVIEPSVGAVYDIFDQNGDKTTASGYASEELVPYSDGLVIKNEDHKGVTYQQLMNVMTIALSGETPASGSFEDFNRALERAQESVSVELDNSGRFVIKDKTASESVMQISLFDADTDRFGDYTYTTDKTLLQTYSGAKGEPGWNVLDTHTDRPLSEVFGFNFSGNLVLSGDSIYGASVSSSALNENSTLQELMDAIDATFGDGAGIGGFVTQIVDGRLITRDNTNPNSSLVSIDFLFQGAQIEKPQDDSPAWTFSANNALTIDEPRVNLFDTLQEAIDAVRMGMTRPDGDSAEGSRNIGIQNSIAAVDHLLDHLIKMQTQNGSIGTTLELTYEKSQMLILNVNTLKSEVLDADIGETVVKMNQLSVAYQALLATLNRIHSMSLVNYLQ